MKKVLVAEDDKFLIKAYAAKLKKSGLDVILAVNGEEAVQKIKSEQPDIVLLDLVMPKKDGFEVLAEVQAEINKNKMPVIILSNLGQDEDVERGKKLGVTDYLVKSNTSIQQIAERVKQVLDAKV
jgi:DNA-binding response OmpR family regulator